MGLLYLTVRKNKMVNVELNQNELEMISVSLLVLMRSRTNEAKEIMALRNRIRDILKISMEVK
jgi:hypothetical protein